MQSFGQKSLFCHNLNQAFNQKSFYKICEGPQPKEGYGIKSQNYAVIWSQMFISSQSKLSMESKSYFTIPLKLTKPKEGYEI